MSQYNVASGRKHHAMKAFRNNENKFHVVLTPVRDVRSQIHTPDALLWGLRLRCLLDRMMGKLLDRLISRGAE
jgi:hypothetical protein